MVVNPTCRVESALRIRPFGDPVKMWRVIQPELPRRAHLCVRTLRTNAGGDTESCFYRGRSRSTRRPPTRRLRPRPRLTPSLPAPYRSSLTWAATIKARRPSSTTSQSRSLLERRERLRGGGGERVRNNPLSAVAYLRNRPEMREEEKSVIAPILIGTAVNFEIYVPCPEVLVDNYNEPYVLALSSKGHQCGSTYYSARARYCAFREKKQVKKYKAARNTHEI